MSDDIDAVIEDPGRRLRGGRAAVGDPPDLRGRAVFPFPAEVVGSPVEVVGVDYEGDERRGLVARCRRNGQGYTVALIDVAPSRLTERTAALIAAYRRWSGVEAGPDRR